MHSTQLPSPGTDNAIQSLYQLFSTLDDNEKALLWVLSVVYKPIGIKKLQSLMTQLYIGKFLADNMRGYELTIPRREALIKQSLILKVPHGLQLNPLLYNRLSNDLELLPTQTDMSATEKFRIIISAAEEYLPTHTASYWQDKSVNFNRLVRDALYLDDIALVEEYLKFNKNPQVIDYQANECLTDLFFVPYDLTAFTKISEKLQYQAFATLIRQCQQCGQSANYAIELLERFCRPGPDNETVSDNLLCRQLLAEHYLYQARLDDFREVHHQDDVSCYGLQLSGIHHFLTGDIQKSVEFFQKALVAKNKIAKRKNQYLGGIPGQIFKLALLVSGNNYNVSHFNLVSDQIAFESADRKVEHEFFTIAHTLRIPLKCLSEGLPHEEFYVPGFITEEKDVFYSTLNQAYALLTRVWCSSSTDKKWVNLARRLDKKFITLGYPLFAQWCRQIEDKINNKETLLTDGHINICHLIQPRLEWELALDKLIALAPGAEPEPESESNKAVKPQRLIWVFETGRYFELQPKEQKLGKNGWSKGRVVSLKRLYEESESMDFLSPADKALCDFIQMYRGWDYYSKTEYMLGGIHALKMAIGMDNIYDASDLSRPVEIIEKTPELMVSQQGDELCLTIPDFSDCADKDTGDEAYAFREIADHQYQVTLFNADHIKVGNIIGETGLLIPNSAKERALEGISAIAPMLNIQSDVAELDTGLENSDCDPNLIINIQPFQQGLSFTCVVMPFGEEGPAYKPGVGNTSITADVVGKKLATQRDLLREEKLLDQLDQLCPAFLGMSDNVLLSDELSNALEVLEQLEIVANNGDMDLVLRWPKGKKLKLSHTLKSEHLQLSVGKNKEWFDISGDLRINDNQVLELRKLLALITTSNGRFIELDAEQILVLSDDLRQKLDKINEVTDEGKFHPLASLQMEEATTGMRMKTLHAWEKQTQKMHQANEITPRVPSTFQGELRDYQLAGFDWATRLAHWGAGACLADDMGLGKTLQALSVLLNRAGDGPSLVIAPTSVCFNWQQEALKFAPTLNTKLFADASNTEQRETLLNDVKPFDCVIISYGLLQRESDLLKEVQWHTIVADEAQALKNPLTKRTKAAYALKGDFKMITTGTPVENDLTELWSLFRFINPGLLGNIKRFGDRFAMPIENAEEDRLAARKASQGLKTLIQPFILRRMKNQVLTELPSRTEITVQVSMSEKEQSFYEALRLNAIDNISNADEQTNMGEQRIRMLAELMKLRQACCNPKLVTPEIDLPSAKLEALDELLEELRLNNHKALIFSQFVGHLQLIEEHVKAKGFSYQYLDGSTPQKARQKRVNAFQSGEGELFLISLKAGGSGLNLTAADYVIHMDPWWNPAVEEQASDRAHRLGQKRPVTIYRLVTQNTIEEKIVALHQHKRDIADQVLSGNEVATKLSVDDMLVLLKDTF